MLKTFGTISLIGIVIAIAAAGSYVTPPRSCRWGRRW